MAQDKGPPGLNPRVAKLLLDKLETDDAFREAFARAPAEALRKLGHTEAAPCLALKPGATLASPEQRFRISPALWFSFTMPSGYSST